MNQTKLKYVRERAQAIYNRKQEQVRDKYRADKMTVEEKVEALQKGEFTIKVPEESYNRSSWVSYVEFNAEPRANKNAMNDELEKLREQYIALKDELILGDEVEALKLLKAFEFSE